MKKQTKSLCPACLKVIPATIYDDNNKVYITKACPEHGEYTELYWGDYRIYQQAEKYAQDGATISNPRTVPIWGCPSDCGVCPNHKSTTTLGIIDVTNRCNLRCPICFAHAGAAGYIYEPTQQQIREMMKSLLANRPVWTPALQLSGGEPTVREDLPELLEMAKELGFIHVEVNSNGIMMAESAEYCRELKHAGADTVYLQFDGVTPKPYLAARGFDLLPIKLRAIENLRTAGFNSIALVPTLVKGVNDGQVGDIIRYAMANHDCIRAVNFQPVSITGRIDVDKRTSMRITIPDLMKQVEEQTGGFIKTSDWFPIPAAKPLTDLLSSLKSERFVDFACHPHCGMATYLVEERGELIPITRLLEVDEALEAFTSLSGNLHEGMSKKDMLRMVKELVGNLGFKSLSQYLLDVVLHGDYLSLNRLHHRMILIGSMHFMDPYNFDLDRVQRCIIHYAVPDGRLIPFCTMNTLHRRSVEKSYAKAGGEATPLYDVESLRGRILREEIRSTSPIYGPLKKIRVQ